MYRIAFLLLFGAGALRAENYEFRLEAAKRDRVIVELRDAANVERFRRSFAAEVESGDSVAAVQIRHKYVRAMFGVAVEGSREVIDRVRRLPDVRAVHPDRTVEAYGTVTVDAAARVNAGAVGTRGEGITVGVIDTGIDYRHSAFGNGFGPGHKVAGGWDFVSNDADPLDDHGHGTHVAGIIAADSAELTGVAPGATLIAYKVLGPTGTGFTSDIIAAIERSIDPNQDGDTADHLDVINLSLGGRGTADDLASRAVDNATAAGVIVVVAAGNSFSVGSIGSPGTARSAITVGAVDDDGVMTSFSSRGPTASLLTFKPDVVSAGFEVMSAKRGGGIVAGTGTSMAAPHVAGVAALLRKLRPDWTPADVKSALITTAVKTDGSPVARAAGRVDAQRAIAATTFVDGGGVSFGIAPSKSGSSEFTRSITVTNRASVAHELTVEAPSVPAGATLTATPASLYLEPGASQTIELQLIVDNALLVFPPDGIAGGDIEFRGDAPFALPWAIVRSARVTVTNDAPALFVYALSAAGIRDVRLYEARKGEMFVPPDSTWDVVLASFDTTALRLIAAEERVAIGDAVLALRGSDATVRIDLDARDVQGRRFAELPHDLPSGIGHFASLRTNHEKGSFSARTSFQFSGGAIFLSPLSSAFMLQPFEVYVDLKNRIAYNAQHAMLRGVSESKPVTIDPASYSHARVRLHGRDPKPHILLACPWNALQSGTSFSGSSSCLGRLTDEPMAVDYYTTTESDTAFSGIWLDGGGVTVPTLRGFGGAIVATFDRTPSPAVYRIANGEEVAVGTTALFPLLSHGNTGTSLFIGLAGFTGPLGESHSSATAGATWTLFDEQNAKHSAGTLSSMPQPQPRPGYRYVAIRDGFNVAGHHSIGELEVRFGNSEADLMAPTLTSLRILNAQNRMTDRVDPNSAAALVFSAADYDFQAGTLMRQMRTESTRAWYRIAGSMQWHPLPVTFEDADDGGVPRSRLPVGDLYRADLSAATAAPALIDLRIEIEDALGNRTSWTQSPAFMVGTITPPPRRRSVQ